MHRFLTVILFLWLFALGAFAQSSEKQELAFEYYRNKEYDKAASLFYELYQNQGNSYFFAYYIASLEELKNFNEAEKSIKKEIKNKPDDYSLKIMLGNLYKLSGNSDAMKKQYDDVIKSLNINLNQYFQAANAFISNQEFTLAEITYLKGQKMLKGQYSFHLELASLYQIQKMNEKMIDEYIALLYENPQMIQTVQNRLQQSVYSSQDKSLMQLLQNKLIVQTQKNPDATLFSELLIWLYSQQLQFNNALNFAIALDKRNKEDGSRIFSLAQTAVSNKDYATALKAYQYIISKGAQGTWYFEAKNEYLITLYLQITNEPVNEKSKIIELEKSLEQHLSNNGINKNTFSVIIALAKVKAYYLQKVDESIELLKKVSENTQPFAQNQISEAKLLLGDLTLMKNDIWEATILYTQVEKNNGNEPIAHEAKFKKAMLAYYNGDFLWAQAQMDVLKASTSKLIANDAFSLSQFINENIEADSSQRTLKTFSNADFYSFRHLDSLALLCLDTILINKDAYSLYDDAFLRKGDIFLKNKKFDQAIVMFDTVLTRFKTEINAPIAAYKLANLYQYQLNDVEKAKHYLELLFTQYPGSFYADEARKRFRIIRGDIIEDKSDTELNLSIPMP
ncbi:MAG TPA: tetratricopeptide repeat protein [Bacteroidales bacterium]|nr:tetratricopeptide repeat protein [Bacteroidales bacterium]